MSKDSLSSSVSVSRIIPKEESSDFQTWSVPEVKSKTDEQLAELADVPMLTAEQLEEIHQQAYQEGYQEGQNQGYSEGLLKGQEEGKAAGHKQAFEASLAAIQNQTFHFEQIFKSLQEPLTQVSEQLEHEIVSLAIAIAKQIIGEEIQTNPERILSLVKQTLQLLPSKAQDIKIFLHPSDLILVKNAFELEDDLDLSKYHLCDDVNLKRGGCIVDTDISHIDASLDKRIKDIADNLIPPAPEGTEGNKKSAQENLPNQEQSQSVKADSGSPNEIPNQPPLANDGALQNENNQIAQKLSSVDQTQANDNPNEPVSPPGEQ